MTVQERENAVAPDWNLKQLDNITVVRGSDNAVAPDWNLKLGQHVHPH